MPKSNARFIFENARITRVTRREKVSWLTLYLTTGKFEQWLDVTCFEGVSDNFGEGESVTIKGDVQLAKKKDGEKYGHLQCIARTILPGDESQTPALPTKSGRAPNPESVPQDDTDVPF